MKFLLAIFLLTVTRPVLSALQRTNVHPDLSVALVARPSNTTLNAIAPKYATVLLRPVPPTNPLKSRITVSRTDTQPQSAPVQRTKTYHVINSPVTLNFFAYAAPASPGSDITFQTLLTALNSIYHSTLVNHGDGLIRRGQAFWTYRGAAVIIENHGVDRTGQLTWGMLADTMYGVGCFFQQEGYSTGEWTIDVEGLGKIGSGYVGARVRWLGQWSNRRELLGDIR